MQVPDFKSLKFTESNDPFEKATESEYDRGVCLCEDRVRMLVCGCVVYVCVDAVGVD